MGFQDKKQILSVRIEEDVPDLQRKKIAAAPDSRLVTHTSPIAIHVTFYASSKSLRDVVRVS